QSWLATLPTYAQLKEQSKAVDAAAGQALFQGTCATCHGANGEGNKDLNAPKLAGQADWYLARQLQAFRDGVRGAHEKDVYGKQMIPFASMLQDEASVRNVVAYIATLPDARPPASVMGNPTRGKEL